MRSLVLLTFLLTFLGCLNPKKSELVFQEIQNNEVNKDSLIINSNQPSTLNLRLVMVEQEYILNKFIDLFGIEQTIYPVFGQYAGITHLNSNSLYDRIMPAIKWFGFYGSKCDLYESTNAWPYRASHTTEIENDNWHQSCFHYHRYTAERQSDKILLSANDPARWAITARICHQAISERLVYFLENKININIDESPEITQEMVTLLFNQFKLSYQPSEEEVLALVDLWEQADQLPEASSYIQKWALITQAVCESPFWQLR